MLKGRVHIVDTLFAHASSSSWYNEPSNFEWVRKPVGDDVVVFTDTSLSEHINWPGKKKIAWLLESPLVTEGAYEYIKNNYSHFDHVFTFDKDLLDMSDKFILLPIGGCWIESMDRVVHEKTKTISTIVSNKRKLSGHKLRHDIIAKFDGIDVFGKSHTPLKKKISGLQEYRFSIAVENCKRDYYFTEKLIDCFVTGTVPIYWGCPSIGDFFDIDGIITFDTIDDLYYILSNLTEKSYLDRLQSINNNIIRAQDYIIADDILYEKIKDNE